MQKMLQFQFNAKKIIEEGRTTQFAVDTINKWLPTTSLPHLPQEFIVLFLLSCLNDISTTKRTIEAYFKIKNKAPYIFNKWRVDAEEIKKLIEVSSVCVVPTRMNKNTAIICTKLKDFNYRKLDAIAVIKLSCMVFHLIQLYDPPDDVVLLLNMEGIDFRHLSCIKMRAMKAHLEFVQEGMPLKIRDIHILNASYLFDKVLNLFKVFIKSELISTIKTHSPGMSFDEFHEKWIPADFQPKDYGGKLPFIEELMERTVEELNKSQPFFEAEEQLRSSYTL